MNSKPGNALRAKLSKASNCTRKTLLYASSVSAQIAVQGSASANTFRVYPPFSKSMFLSENSSLYVYGNRPLQFAVIPSKGFVKRKEEGSASLHLAHVLRIMTCIRYKQNVFIVQLCCALDVPQKIQYIHMSVHSEPITVYC